jgi:hypothetical protein
MRRREFITFADAAVSLPFVGGTKVGSNYGQKPHLTDDQIAIAFFASSMPFPVRRFMAKFASTNGRSRRSWLSAAAARSQVDRAISSARTYTPTSARLVPWPVSGEGQ